MLPKRNIEVQSRGAHVDVISAMRIDRLQPSEQRIQDDAIAPDAPRRLSIPELAHELNSQLDGSLRYLALVESEAYPGMEPDDRQTLERRLTGVRRALTNMANVLGRAMTDDETGAQLLRRDDSLLDVAREVMEAVRPAAEEGGVETSLEVDLSACEIPAGPLGSVLTNGVRNAVEACQRCAVGIRRVEVVIDVLSGADELEIIITDSGPGLSGYDREPGPYGHGIGLDVCREVVGELGGRLTLTNVPFGRGAVMQVYVPVRSLRQP